VQGLVRAIWGAANQSVRPVGKGKLIASGNANDDARESLSLRPSFQFLGNPIGLRATHRKEGSSAWFFVINGSEKTQAFAMSFAVTGMQPELWDAETGSISPAPVWRDANQRTEVELQLAANKSIFVMFRHPLAKTSPHFTTVSRNAATLVTAANGEMHWISDEATTMQLTDSSGRQQTQQLAACERRALAGDWQVDFQPVLGKPFRAKLASLIDLSTHDNPEIRYFSGTATYNLRVQIPRDQLNPQNRILLRLGQVRDMADVRVNDQPLGIWWHAPFERDITAALHEGENTLSIAVTNTWHNLLVGDERYPIDCEWGTDRGGQGRGIKGYPEWFVKNQPRPSSQRKAFVLWYYHRDSTPLLPAGLLGPVELRSHSAIATTPR
jgi:hypothetical protein